MNDTLKLYTPMLNTPRLLKVEQYLEYQTLIIIHKMELRFMPIYLRNCDTKFINYQDYETKGKSKVIIALVQNEIEKKSAFHRGVLIYKSLKRGLITKV